MSDEVYRAECKHEDCGWSFEHEQPVWVLEAAENHEDVYRTHPQDHETTEPKKVMTDGGRAASESEDRQPAEETEFTEVEAANETNTVATFRFEPGDDASQTRINVELLDEAIEEYCRIRGERRGDVHLTVVEDGPAVLSTFPDGVGYGVAPLFDEDEIESGGEDGAE